jgi:hypothetical protein
MNNNMPRGSKTLKRSSKLQKKIDLEVNFDKACWKRRL